ncbi:MAG: AlpA family phage regulatory protein [Georgfuchsia sp.]
MTQTILRLPAVLGQRGRSRSSHYADIQQGLCTRPVVIGLRAVGWPANEIAALNAARIAGKTDSEIRTLVVSLETARKVADQDSAQSATTPDAGRLGRCAAAAGMTGAGEGKELYVPVTRKVTAKRVPEHA